MSNKLSEFLWVEKYRPKKLSDVVLPERYIKDFEKYISKQKIPNLIFHGVQGSGKTTLARILISNTGIIQNPKDNVLQINGSSRLTRGISFVSDTIEPFLKIPPAGNDQYRIVFIDEADYLTDQAFHSLRAIIEKYLRSGRFILTCNYVSKIPDPLLSRLTEYKFKLLPKEHVLKYCKHILESENVEFKEEDIMYVVSMLYPDIRKIVSTLQKMSENNKLVLDQDIEITTEKAIIAQVVAIIEKLKRKDNNFNIHINKILSKIINEQIDYKSIYYELFIMKEVPPPIKIVINKYSNAHNSCLIPEMHFSALIFEIIKVMNEYNSMRR